MKTFASLVAALTVGLAAGAASAQEARISWSDLDLSSAAGADAFDARIAAAARKLCRSARSPGRLINDRAWCRAAVQAEAVRQLPGRVQVDYALSRVPVVV